MRDAKIVWQSDLHGKMKLNVLVLGVSFHQPSWSSSPDVRVYIWVKMHRKNNGLFGVLNL